MLGISMEGATPKLPNPADPNARVDKELPSRTGPSETSTPEDPQLTSIASESLKASSTSFKLKEISPKSKARPFTGAAALEDERRQKEIDAHRHRSASTSVNPAMSAVNSLRGASSPEIGRHEATSPANKSTVSTQNNVTSMETVEEPMQIDQGPTTSPTSITSSDGNNPSGQPSASALHHVAHAHVRGNNKALTYPPPPPHETDSTAPSRGMSLPGSSLKSPMSKKHRCPHCSTEFTRHHNLKSHLLTHSQEKPFTCQSCGAKFRRLHDLKRHSKLHTGERPHICIKCGRKFARGDALARHNKGPGGCAGRRSSIGDNEFGDTGSNGEDGMDFEYQRSPQSEQFPDPQRRKSEPGRRDRNNSLQHHAGTSPTAYRNHSSTFPGVAAMSGVVHKHPGASDPKASPSHLSPRTGTGASSLGPQYPSSSGFAQSGLTDSPKPLSPGHNDSRGHGNPQSIHGAQDRSPNHMQNYQHHSQGRAGSVTTPINLPPPGGHSTQLPSLTSLSSEHRASGMSSPGSGAVGLKNGPPPPIISTHPPPPSGPPSATSTNAGSGSSHRQSSGGSMREILNVGSQGPGMASADPGLQERIRKLEGENREIREELHRKASQYDATLTGLQEENQRLRMQYSSQHRTDPQAN